jgi:hypothetical protein
VVDRENTALELLDGVVDRDGPARAAGRGRPVLPLSQNLSLLSRD